MMRRIRADWPPGSNARLLNGQVRGAFGYTDGRPGERGAVPVALAANFVPQAKAVPGASVAEPPAEPQPIRERLLAMLRGLARDNLAVPATPVLAHKLGVQPRTLAQAISDLNQTERIACIHRNGRRYIAVDGVELRRDMAVPA